MSTFARLLRICAALSCSTLLTACMGLGVMAPHTQHRQQTPADKPAAPGLISTRDEIIARHGESAVHSIRLNNGIEQITVTNGRTYCGVMLLVLPIFPRFCPARTQYELIDDQVIATHERRTRFYGITCTPFFPLFGKNSICALFPD